MVMVKKKQTAIKTRKEYKTHVLYAPGENGNENEEYYLVRWYSISGESGFNASAIREMSN